MTGQYKDIWKYLVYNVNPGQSYTATVTSDIVSNKTMTQASFVAKRVVNCKIGDNAAEMIVYFSTMERANAYTVEKFKALTNEITEVTSFGDVQVL